MDVWEVESDEDEDVCDCDGVCVCEVGMLEEEDGDVDDARSSSAREDATRIDGGIDGLVLCDGVVDVLGCVVEKMFMGWMLMNDVCLVLLCSVSFVRNRAGESFCVRYEMFV